MSAQKSKKNDPMSTLLLMILGLGVLCYNGISSCFHNPEENKAPETVQTPTSTPPEPAPAKPDPVDNPEHPPSTVKSLNDKPHKATAKKTRGSQDYETFSKTIENMDAETFEREYGNFYRDFVAEMNRATDEAKTKYHSDDYDVNTQTQEWKDALHKENILSEKLYNRYTDAVRRRYHLSGDDAQIVFDEGVKRGIH